MPTFGQQRTHTPTFIISIPMLCLYGISSGLLLKVGGMWLVGYVDMIKVQVTNPFFFFF